MKAPGKTVVALLAAAALILVPAQAALAKLPPSGNYGCVLASANQYLGDLKIKGNRYKINKSAWGEMKNPKGNKIRFKTGAWKNLFRGEWERAKSVLEPGTYIVEIELTELESGYESSYCTKE
jgi:hypothetical protein